MLTKIALLIRMKGKKGRHSSELCLPYKPQKILFSLRGQSFVEVYDSLLFIYEIA